MRWFVFAIFAYLALAMQVGLGEAIGIPSRFGAPIEPRFVLLLAVYIGLNASTSATVIGWMTLGLLVDVTASYPGGLTLIGPYTLGYLAGAYCILLLRPMLFARHPLAFAFVTLFCGAAVHLIVVATFTIRAWYDPLPGWSATTDLALRGLSLLYTAAIGALFAMPMFQLAPLFAFQAAGRNAPRRAR